jgi:hypothetical protein
MYVARREAGKSVVTLEESEEERGNERADSGCF